LEDHAGRSDILIPLCQNIRLTSSNWQGAVQNTAIRNSRLKSSRWPSCFHIFALTQEPLSAPVDAVKRVIRRRRRRKMTEAAKKAISERMKKLWAARRKAK
jgi:hypothetical protein